MAISRTPDRTQSTRTATKRPEGWVPPNSMPNIADHLGPDVKLRWIRRFYNGAEEDKQSFFKRMQRGWTPVKPEEVPSLENLVDSAGNVVWNGCILCKRSATDCKIDVEYYEDMALGALASAKAEFMNDAHSAMPKFSEGVKTKVFRGKLPS